MALTTHEKIRLEAGFQSTFTREALLNTPNGSQTTFFVNSDDNVKFVPNLGSGGTIAGLSDIQVFIGLSGVYGVSQLQVSALDIEQGSVSLNAAPPTGSSLTINYASSAVTSAQIEDIRLQAEGIVNQRLSLCYDLPLAPTPSSVTSLATRLSAAMLLIRNYGTGSQSTASDGYGLYNLLMGENHALLSSGTDAEQANVGEIGLICSANYQLVDDAGNVIPRNDIVNNGDNNVFVAGGRVRGRLYDVTEEQFRYKDWQNEVNQDQGGSGL